MYTIQCKTRLWSEVLMPNTFFDGFINIVLQYWSGGGVTGQLANRLRRIVTQEMSHLGVQNSIKRCATPGPHYQTHLKGPITLACGTSDFQSKKNCLSVWRWKERNQKKRKRRAEQVTTTGNDSPSSWFSSIGFMTFASFLFFIYFLVTRLQCVTPAFTNVRKYLSLWLFQKKKRRNKSIYFFYLMKGIIRLIKNRIMKFPFN